MAVVELWEENPMELSFHLVDREAKGVCMEKKCQCLSFGKRTLWSSAFTWWTKRPNELCLE
jgi:hypothetical protein